MYNYKLYGLYISSCIEFNFLKTHPPGPKPDVIIKESDRFINYESERINLDEAILYRKNVAYFKIKQGNEISFYRDNSSVKNDLLSRTIINSIMGYCLYQRECFVLHGSAVEINNSSYLFIGPSGSGKSTLSANLSIKHNANFICEDVAYIQRFKNKYSIVDAPKFVKLTDEASKMLGFKQSDKIDLPSDRLDRSLYKIDSKSCSNKLRACFFLEWGSNFEIKELNKDQLLPAFLISTFSAYPFNTCKESTLIFNKNIKTFSNNIPIYKLIRIKEDFYTNTERIVNFIENIKKEFI